MSVRYLQLKPGSTLFYAGLGAAAGAAVSVVTVGVLRHASALPAPPLLSSLVEAAGSQVYWHTARAGGLLAYLLLWLGAVSGVLLSGKQVKGLYFFGLHEFLPILAMVFAAIHALVLLGDRYISFGLVQIAIPFTAPYRPLWTGLGTLAFYLGTALAASFYLRHWIGRQTWRLLHYATYLVFGLALAHGLMAGTDSKLDAVRWMYVATGAVLLFVTLVRVLTVRRTAAAGVRANKSRPQRSDKAVVKNGSDEHDVPPTPVLV